MQGLNNTPVGRWLDQQKGRKMYPGILVFRNKRNENKYIDVKRSKCGHYYIVQYMVFENKDATIINYMGCRRKRFSRITKRTLLSIIEDYDLCSTKEIEL